MHKIQFSRIGVLVAVVAGLARAITFPPARAAVPLAQSLPAIQAIRAARQSPRVERYSFTANQ
ncbi:hypothetical protein QP237_23550, partial [Escherichia coli]|nr:hypothetical protein [Escherichia coli]